GLITLIFTLLFSGAAWAQEGTNGGAAAPAMKKQFPDVIVGHWAEKSIAKLGLLGVTAGDSLGKFNPKQDITREEVIIMAIKIMGLNDEVDRNTSANFGFHVSDFAIPFVIA